MCRKNLKKENDQATIQKIRIVAYLVIGLRSILAVDTQTVSLQSM